MPARLQQVALFFTDIEGSTRLWEASPDAMRVALREHDALLRQAIESRGGYVFKTLGDAFCATFPDAPSALDAALDAQRQLQATQWEDIPTLRVRMALHVGEADVRDDDYFGPSLSRVARLLTVGHGGQILLSRAAGSLLENRLPADVSLRDLGTHRLRDLQQSEMIAQVIAPDLPADFPPLRSLQSYTNNLPLQISSFVGRELDMIRIKELLPTARLVTLTGAGGAGKTRLALQIGADLLDAYPDGVWLVELAALADPKLVPQSVAASLGLREEPGRPIAKTLSDYLADKSLLLLLDNCEHLIADCARLASGLLRGCPRLSLLATSREPLAIAGETTYRVPPLSLPDVPEPTDLPALNASGSSKTLLHYESVRLFTERTATLAPAFALTDDNAPAVAQLCRRLDGIPLAIELAAARVKALPVEQIVERLDDRFRLLTGGSRVALPRQQTLRALIDWSYDLLEPAERDLLDSLSVFAGGWTLEAAETVCADEENGPFGFEVVDLLLLLVDKSLVVYEERGGEARYGLGQTVRQYTAERLERSGRQATLRARHAAHYAQMADRALTQKYRGPEQIAALNQLETEHDNMRAALTFHLSPEGDPLTALQIMEGLKQHWCIRGYFAEGQNWLMRASQAAGDLAPLTRAYTLISSSALCWFQTDYERLERQSREALALAEPTGDAWAITSALILLGSGMSLAGKREEAAPFLARSLQAAAHAEDTWLRAQSLHHAGMHALRGGNLETAMAQAGQALQIAGAEQELWTMALANRTLGLAALAQHDITGARARLGDAIRLYQELRYRWGVAASLEGLARIVLVEGRAQDSARLYGAASRLRDQTGTPVPPIERPAYDQALAAVRAALTDDDFARVWTQGRALTLDEAIALALL